jgi:hypothetical protein
MLGLRIPIVPVRGQMWASDPLPPRLFHTISAAESSLQWHTAPGNDTQTPPYLTHRGQQRLTRHLYGRQTRTGEIIFGGDRQLVEYQKRPDSAGIEVNHGHAAEVLPFLRELPVARTWAGLMPPSRSMEGRSSAGSLSTLIHTSSVGWHLLASVVGLWRASCSPIISIRATGLMCWRRQTRLDVSPWLHRSSPSFPLPWSKDGALWAQWRRLLDRRYDADQTIDANAECVGHRAQFGFLSTAGGV